MLLKAYANRLSPSKHLSEIKIAPFISKALFKENINMIFCGAFLKSNSSLDPTFTSFGIYCKQLADEDELSPVIKLISFNKLCFSLSISPIFSTVLVEGSILSALLEATTENPLTKNIF